MILKLKLKIITWLDIEKIQSVENKLMIVKFRYIYA